MFDSYEVVSYEVPAELRGLSNTLYKSIINMIKGDSTVLNPTTIRVLIKSAMSIVENFRNADGRGWDGPQKKKIALSLIRFVFIDLVAKGHISKDVAEEFLANLDFWGGL